MIDNHTHTLSRNAVVNIDPAAMARKDMRLLAGYLYSVGIHPWNTGLASCDDLRWLRALAVSPRVVAIGETGLDLVHTSYRWKWEGDEWTVEQAEPDLDAQMEMLDYHIFLSEHLHKPLLLHIVKKFPDIMRLRNKLKPSQPWIIHGFRGKPGLAADLLRFGFYLSYGERFNPLSVAVTPRSRLLVETDESSLPVGVIASRLGVVPGVSVPSLFRASQRVASQP
ncbi:MAG: TatD family hydrolase [Duncaniella sp.]|nr:TatD family hydrolase [Duncaniella sp.]